MMKRWLAFFLALLMTLSLCACGNDDAAPAKDNVDSETATTNDSTAPVGGDSTVPNQIIDGATENGGATELDNILSAEVEISFDRPNVEQTEPNAPTVIYTPTCYDESYGSGLVAEIEKISFGKREMYITAKLKKYNMDGDEYSFATQAIQLDKDNRILEINQCMYFPDLTKESVGQTFVDDVWLADGVATIIICDNTGNEPALIAKDHGDTTLKLDYEKLCYDSYDSDKNRPAVQINSWNVYDDKLFLVYTLRKCVYEDSSFATTMYFYDAAGNIIDDKQAMYMEITSPDRVGHVGYDEIYIPDGAVRAEILSYKPNGINDDHLLEAPKGDEQVDTSGNGEKTAWTDDEIVQMKAYCDRLYQDAQSFYTFMQSSSISSQTDRKVLYCDCVTGVSMGLLDPLGQAVMLAVAKENMQIVDTVSLEQALVGCYTVNLQIYNYFDKIHAGNVAAVESELKSLVNEYIIVASALYKFAQTM